MDQVRLPKPGEIYNHFKDKPYQIIAVATHSDTNEQMVVYQALYGDFKMYVRPLTSFLSEVDHVKYPEVKQDNRFELKTAQEENNKKAAEVEVNTSEVNKAEVQSVNPAQDITIKTPDGEVDLLLMKFLDAESYSKKLEVLSSNRKHLNDRLINDMAVSLDCAVDEGPLDIRIQGLTNCLQAMCRFENRRLR